MELEKGITQMEGGLEFVIINSNYWIYFFFV